MPLEKGSSQATINKNIATGARHDTGYLLPDAVRPRTRRSTNDPQRPRWSRRRCLAA